MISTVTTKSCCTYAISPQISSMAFRTDSQSQFFLTLLAAGVPFHRLSNNRKVVGQNHQSHQHSRTKRRLFPDTSAKNQNFV